jgi:tetratricopeptide (TPR) repeat protein/Cdc6-like AAA superfamily ATPase
MSGDPKEVFLSYAWGDASEEFANQLDQAFQRKGIRVIRDKRDLAYKGLIKEFMERLGQGKCVIAVISDKYLKSPNCMFELIHVVKNGNFYDRIFPIVLGDAQIYEPVQRIEYIRYWEDKKKNLTEAIGKVGPEYLQGIREEIDHYTEIRNTIAELTNILNNMNTLTPDIHSRSDFEALVESVNSWLGESISRQLLPVEPTTPGGNVRSRYEQEQRIRSGLEEQRQNIVRESERQQGKSRRRVVGSLPLPDLTHFFKGRSKEQSDLSRLLAEPATHVVSIIGRMGIGKTALAKKILMDLEQGHWPHTEDSLPVDGIVYLSTRTKGITLEQIFHDCAQMLGGKQEEDLNKTWAAQCKIEDKIQSLLGAMSDGLYVLLLDHVDDLLNDKGEITDEGVRAFFEISLATPQSARLLVTSQVPLAFRREAQRFDKRVPLHEGLSVAEGVAMLRDLDASGEARLRDAPEGDLARAVERVHGIPRALEVLAGIMRDAPLARLGDVLQRFFQNEDVAEALIREGYKRLDDQARRVMEALAIFGRPVPLPALDYLLQPFMPGLDTPEIVQRLIRAQMVLVNRETQVLSLHPFDQDYIYSQCPDHGEYNCQALERRAANWYVQLRVPREHWRTLDGLEPLLLEFEHRVKAGDYDNAAAVLSEIEVDYLIMSGLSARALAMRQKVDGKITDRRLQMLHAYGLACAYQVLGPFAKAKDCFEKALALARELGEPIIEADSLDAMSEVSRRLGRLDDAKDYLDEAINLYRRIGEQRREARSLGAMSILCSYRGDLQEALDHGQHALSLSTSLGEIEGQALAYDALSLAYLAIGDLKQTIRYGEEAITVYHKSAWEHSLVYVLNVLGLAYIGLGRMDEGLTCLLQARQQAHEDNNTRVEGLALFNLARAYRLKNDPANALIMASGAKAVFIEVGSAEAHAARALVEVIQAAKAGLRSAEARALLDCARHSLMSPDLYNPSDLVAEARAIAQAEGLADVLREAEGLRRASASGEDKIDGIGTSGVPDCKAREGWPQDAGSPALPACRPVAPHPL